MMTDLDIFVRMPIDDKQNYTIPIKMLKKVLAAKPKTLNIKVLEKGKVINPEKEKNVLLKDKLVILLTGKAIPLDQEKNTYIGPALVENADRVEFGKNCMIFVC